jgi:asparagine synthase (glutamine-hydrolysing)
VDSLLGPLHLERLFLGRHKFYHFRYWYRDSLAGYVQDTLLNSTALSRPYLHAEKVRSLVQRHVTGAGNYTTEIHKLLTLELVHRLLLDAR